MATKERLNYIDWLKAIGIFLIVIGHCLPAYTEEGATLVGVSCGDLGQRPLPCLSAVHLPQGSAGIQ